MTNIRNFWVAHRDRIASIIFWPYVISLIIFVVYSFCSHVQIAEDGLSSLPQAFLWAITLMGGLITPVIAIRSWVAIFHDDADVLTVVLASPVWGGGYHRRL